MASVAGIERWKAFLLPCAGTKGHAGLSTSAQLDAIRVATYRARAYGIELARDYAWQVCRPGYIIS